MTAVDGVGSSRAELREHIIRVLTDGEWRTARELVEGTSHQPSEATALLRSLRRDGTIESRISPHKVGNTQPTLYRLKGIEKEADPPMTPVVTTKMISRTGNSLVLTVTEEARLLDLRQGDYVKVTIERL